MKNLVRLNMITAIIIMIFAVVDLVFYIITGYIIEIFPTIMLIASVVLAALGGLLGWRLKSAGVKFKDNFISHRLGGISVYFNDFSTLIAGLALLASSFVIGYVNVLALGAGLYTVLTSLEYLKEN